MGKKWTNNRVIWISCIVLVIVIMMSAGIHRITEINRATMQDGVLDLTSWDESRPLGLNGTVEFYWGKLLTQDDLIVKPEPDCFPTVPSVWNYYKMSDGTKPSGTGYATFHIHVTGAQPGKALAMRVQPFSTAYEFYIDNKLMASCGKVGISASSSSPEYAIRVFEFTPQSDHFDIIIHVSNYDYAKGDFGIPLILERRIRLNDWTCMYSRAIFSCWACFSS